MNQNDLKSNVARLILAFFGGPMLLAYELLLAFFVVNGVSGSSKWLGDYWNKFGRIKGLFLMILGTVAWVWVIIRST